MHFVGAFLSKKFLPFLPLAAQPNPSAQSVKQVKQDTTHASSGATGLQKIRHAMTSQEHFMAWQLRMMLTKNEAGSPRQSCIDACGKPSIHHAVRLKDGREAIVRRLQPQDAAKLSDFLDRADFLGAGGAIAYQIMGKEAARKYELDQLLRGAAADGHDVLIAEVDGAIEGLSEYRPVDLDETEVTLKHDGRFTDVAACVSATSVSPQARGIGIGTALKEAQMRSAARAGYEAVIGETDAGNTGMLRIAGKLQGSVLRMPSQTWVCFPLRQD